MPVQHFEPSSSRRPRRLLPLLTVAAVLGLTAAGAAGDTCAAGAENLCLQGSRFRVSATWSVPGDAAGAARATPLTADTGTFWFFDPDNVELIVKVLDACPVNDHLWVFAAGLTNVEVELVVEDTWSGERRSYRRPAGPAFAPIQDTAAFEGTASYLAARAVEATAGAGAGAAVWERYRLTLERAVERRDTVAWPSSTCNQIDILDHPLKSFVPYMKGAFFLRAVEDEVGRAAIDAALRRFYQAHRGRARGCTTCSTSSPPTSHKSSRSSCEPGRTRCRSCPRERARAERCPGWHRQFHRLESMPRQWHSLAARLDETGRSHDRLVADSA
jgi:hypothetical protein